MLWWDGDGLCLFAKRLDADASSGRKRQADQCRLHETQLSMLLERDRLAASDRYARKPAACG